MRTLKPEGGINMLDEEYVRRDPRIPNTNVGKNEYDEYEYNEPMENGMMPYSLFFILKIMFGFLLIVFIPFLIIDFSNWIGGYLKILAVFIIIVTVSKLLGFGYLRDIDD